MNATLKPGIDISGLALGPKMQACTENERRFAFAYATGLARTATDAARLAGYSDVADGAKVTAFRIMGRPRVVDAIEEVARTEFRGLVGPTLAAAKHLILNSKHPDHAKAVNSMLSRLGFAERSGVDVNVTGEVTVNHTDAALEDLRRLRDLGVSRERLVEVFGFSGLERYEKMLRSLEPKVIDAPVIEVKGSDGD